MEVNPKLWMMKDLISMNAQEYQKSISLQKIGRTFSHRHIFKELLNSGVKEKFVREALYKILTENPITIEFSSCSGEREVDIEQYFRKGSLERRKDYQEIKLELDGVSSTDSNFVNVLISYGQTINLKQPLCGLFYFS